MMMHKQKLIDKTPASDRFGSYNSNFRYGSLVLILGSMIGLSGCAMCCGPHDYDYPNYGGKHERVDATYGRVGSVFSDPYANPGWASPDQYQPSSSETPEGRSIPQRGEDPDELRRRLQRDLEERLPTRPQPEQLPGPDNETANQSHWRFR